MSERKTRLPKMGGESALRHRKRITILAAGLALVAIAAVFFEAFSPNGLDYYLYSPIKRLKLLPQALMGNTSAQKYMAMTYFSHFEPNAEPDKKRFYWYAKAANEGDDYATYVIARSYERGYGVEPDKRTAIDWYGFAAARGDRWSGLRFELRANYVDQDGLLIATAEKSLNARDIVELSGTATGTVFRECRDCPEMVLIPSANGGRPIGISKFEITVADYAACLREKKCWYGRADRPFPYDRKSLDPAIPITDLNLSEIRDYLKWLFRKTGKNYRLPTRQEWVWAAQGGTETKFPWGDNHGEVCLHGNLDSGNSAQKEF